MQELANIIRDYLELPEYFEITEETLVADLIDDSLSMLELVMELEEQYDVNIPSPEKLITVGDVFKITKGV
jgi:acyl carrier protein